MKIYNTFQTHAIIFSFNATWHMQTVATFIVLEARRKWQTLSHHLTSMDWLCWWHNQTAHVVTPSTALTFVTKMSERCKSTSQSAIQVKNWQRIISTEEKLYIYMLTWKKLTNCCNVWFVHSSVHTILDNVDRIIESAKPGTKVFV